MVSFSEWERGEYSGRFTVGGIDGFMRCVADSSYHSDDLSDTVDTCTINEDEL